MQTTCACSLHCRGATAQICDAAKLPGARAMADRRKVSSPLRCDQRQWRGREGTGYIAVQTYAALPRRERGFGAMFSAAFVFAAREGRIRRGTGHTRRRFGEAASESAAAV